ncbi:helix-turn-helix transcriptional regulator [Bacillus sp. ISL-75]|nr:helix-turn-helix domain-containing protein [Bacillus sp. ISL-75]MBT2730289.1 helix-turn-helix transcriptional regulator [Bacillus sp. ISL-75]
MDKKLQIIDRSKSLFQQKGYKSVGIAEILKACNISKGALFNTKSK